MLGLESIFPEVLAEMNKRVNIKFADAVAKGNIKEAYKRAIDNFHRQGIAVISGFVFGYDSDPEKVGEETGRFISESGLDGFTAFVAQPLPGSPLEARMREEECLLYTNYPGDYSLFGAKVNLMQTVQDPMISIEACVRTAEVKSDTRSIAGDTIANFCNNFNRDTEKRGSS